MHAGIGIEAYQNYKSLQSIESRILLLDLLLYQISAKFAISIVLCVGYGQIISLLDDPVVIANQNTDKCMLIL